MTPGFIDVSACWVCGGAALGRTFDALIDLATETKHDSGQLAINPGWTPDQVLLP